MATPVITVENLGKRYLVGHQSAQREKYTALRDVIARNVRELARKVKDIATGQQVIQGDDIEEFWALKDVAFEVKQGEVLGIIGRNGAGKSTLLKILSRITEPTTGRVEIVGRVASLLEVGTGFHPELTGRENIFLNGAILGMSKAEIKAKFDEIVDFAEVERFLDTPVKRYSSGMYVRLAFAVAAHLEPEILILDEVLAVGDVVFQKKCLGKMQNVAASGRTVLFVSHNMQTVASLTDRCICLERGAIVASGSPGDVLKQYLAVQSTESQVYAGPADPVSPTITRVELKTSHPGNTQNFGMPMEVHIQIETNEAVPNSALSFQVMSVAQQPILHVLNLDSELPMLRKAGVHHLVCRFPRLRLYPGNYRLNFYLGASNPRRKYAAPTGVCPFEVTVLDHVRDFYWYPDHATYVEDVEWRPYSTN